MNRTEVIPYWDIFWYRRVTIERQKGWRRSCGTAHGGQPVWHACDTATCRLGVCNPDAMSGHPRRRLIARILLLTSTAVIAVGIGWLINLLSAGPLPGPLQWLASPWRAGAALLVLIVLSVIVAVSMETSHTPSAPKPFTPAPLPTRPTALAQNPPALTGTPPVHSLPWSPRSFFGHHAESEQARDVLTARAPRLILTGVSALGTSTVSRM